jgi:CelD/BcsL family acetyltransferase involved in cellulose biosynthesis
MALEAETLTEVEAAREIAAEWDALAVASSRPYCAPAWMLSWFRHLAPPGSGLRLVAVREAGRLVGVGPFWAEQAAAGSSRYGVLGARLASPTGPLAAAGREPEVAAAIAEALASARPRLSLLEIESEVGGTWHALAAAWPGRPPWVLAGKERPLSRAVFEDGYEAWFASKSSKFRQRARRGLRRLEEKEARTEQVDAAGLEGALEDFERLHGSRWEEEGGSNALVPGWRQMFRDVAAELLPAERLRVFVTAAAGEAVSVWIMLAAGDDVAAWNTGFDEGWSELSPAFYATLEMIEDAARRGESTLSFGGGTTELKLRLADRRDALSNDLIVPPGPAYPVTRLRLAPAQARRLASERLSDQAKARLRSLVGRR